MKQKSKGIIKCIMTFVLTVAMVLGAVPLPFMPGSMVVYAAGKELSGSESYTAQDGDVLTGSTSGTVTIADSANITLNNATINGGIVCEGSATITLVGTNSVTGLSRNLYDPNNTYNSAGIQIGGEGTTLTIRGNGSLTATGGSLSAGIGVRSALSNHNESDVSGGNIVIEGGNIVAQTSGYGAAGIGTGCTFERISSIGTITIKGGTVTATGGEDANGIGNGDAYGEGGTSSVGTITFHDSIDLIDASSISDFGSVVYVHGETDVTASKTDYFAIVESGDRRIIAPKDDTDYTITLADGIEHGTITGATTAKYMETVNITATPDFGYRLSRLVVKDAENNDVASTGNSFFMPKGNVTVSAVFEQGTHGTTEFKLRCLTGPEPGDEQYESFYDGVTTVNLQQGQLYQILKYDEDSYREFLLDNDIYDVTIPYSGGAGTFTYANGTSFGVDYNGESGYYDITMTDAGNGKWSVSILKTVPQMDAVHDQTYTGSAITPEPLVTAGSLSLTKGMDYEYSYTNNINVGTAKVTVTFKGDYASLGSVEKEFNISKATPTVTAPTANTLTYNGNEQELVTAGSTDFGTLLYSLDGESYSETIPKGTDAGTYTVYYKVEGSDNWNAVELQGIEVIISEASTDPQFKSHTLLLSGQIGVNFYMDLSMLTADEKAAAVMEFTVNGKKTTDNFDAGCLNPSSGNYYGFTCYINAVQMADEITAVLKYGDGKTVSQTYSVAEYISYINEHPEGYSNNTIKLVQAIADYGHYSQPFLASNNSWTLGTDHVVMNGCNLYDSSYAEAAKTAVSGNVFTSDTGDSMVEKVTYSLSLESETVLNIYLKMKEGYTGSVSASVGGNAVDAIQQSDGRYRIQIKNIAADKLGDIYDISLRKHQEI